jgi:hypothetical protein
MAQPKLVSKLAAIRADHELLLGVVLSVSGGACEVLVAGVKRAAAIATHVPSLVPQQRVVLMQAAADDWLVTAAWPAAGSESPFQFDAQSGLLRIHAARLQLSAVGAVELQCGDASVRLSLDGKVQIEGAEILSAAVGAHRIEGASIDLN